MTTDVRAIIAGATFVGTTSTEHADAILTALAAHGVELLTDMPEVEVRDGNIYVEETLVFTGVTSCDVALAWAAARRWVAIARYLESEPNPADVDALAALVRAQGDTRVGAVRDIARHLLRAGVRLPEGGAR